MIAPVLKKLGRSDIEAEHEVVANPIACALARLDDKGQGLFGRRQIRCKPALIADIGIMPRILEGLFQAVENLGPHAQALSKAVRAGGKDHEFLDIDWIIGMCAAIDDVHHRHRQGPRRNPADIFVQRQGSAIGSGLGHG